MSVACATENLSLGFPKNIFNKTMAVRRQDSNRLTRDVGTLLVVIGVHIGFADASWNYRAGDPNGPHNWYLTNPDCGGVMQSPINITANSALYDPHLQLFDFSDYAISNGVHMKLENYGGHTAEVMFSGRDLYLKAGSLPDVYKLEQFHFHWGSDGSRGSEHRFNEHFSPLELHLVHRQNRQPNMTVAQSHPFGLAVIGFLFRIGDRNNNYDQLLQYFNHILHADDEYEIPAFPVMNLLPTSARYDYYRYFGSLTTPPCYESVIWSIMSDKIEISQEQLNTFRTLFDEDNHQLVDDFRPIQNLNKRSVYTTKPPSGSSG